MDLIILLNAHLHFTMRQYQKLMNFINREDPKAFVTIYNVSSVQYQPKT